MNVIDNANQVIEFVEHYGIDAGHIYDDNFKPFRKFAESVDIYLIAKETGLFPLEIEEALEYIKENMGGNVVDYGEVVDIFIK